MKTTNQEWGFFGTSMRNYSLSDTATHELFEYAGKALAMRYDMSEDEVVEVLDSRFGRHFSDALFSLKVVVVDGQEVPLQLLKQAVNESIDDKWVKLSVRDYLRDIRERGDEKTEAR